MHEAAILTSMSLRGEELILSARSLQADYGDLWFD